MMTFAARRRTTRSRRLGCGRPHTAGPPSEQAQAGKLESVGMLLMLIDSSDSPYGGGPGAPRGRVRRMLAGGMLCLVLAHFLPVLGGVMLAAFGLLVLVLALYIVDDEPREDA